MLKIAMKMKKGNLIKSFQRRHKKDFGKHQTLKLEKIILLM